MKRLNKKDLLLLASKLIEKIRAPCNTKEDYQSFRRKKNTKPLKQSVIITYQPKTFENSNIVDTNSVNLTILNFAEIDFRMDLFSRMPKSKLFA